MGDLPCGPSFLHGHEGPWWVSCLCCPIVHDSWAGVGVCTRSGRAPVPGQDVGQSARGTVEGKSWDEQHCSCCHVLLQVQSSNSTTPLCSSHRASTPWHKTDWESKRHRSKMILTICRVVLIGWFISEYAAKFMVTKKGKLDGQNRMFS